MFKPGMIIILVALQLFLITNSLSGQSFNKYKKGYYYTSNGDKMAGFIYYPYDYRRFIKYKENKSGKLKKLRVSDIKAFVIQTDSFTVIRNFQNEGASGGLLNLAYDFTEVFQSGKVTLYKHYSSIESGSPSFNAPRISLITYLLRKEGSDELVTVRTNQNKFIESLSIFFGDNEQIKNEILNGKYSKENIDELVSKYNDMQ